MTRISIVAVITQWFRTNKTILLEK